jgi:hypothetical protein
MRGPSLVCLLFAVGIGGLWAVDFGPVRTPGDLAAAMGGSEFPATDLFDAIRRGDVVRLRRHLWNVFAGLTSQDAPETADVPRIPHPIFLSWYTKANLFNAPDESNGRFGLELPKQLASLFGKAAAPAGSANAGKGPFSPVLSKEYFNAPAFTHITHNHLNDGKERTKLNCALGAAVPEERQIRPSFPTSAVVLKTMWRVVSGKQLTALPVWDPESNSAQPDGNDPDSVILPAGRWARFVAVDPDPKHDAGERYADVFTSDGLIQQAHVVPLSSFYSIRIDANTLGTAAELTHQAADPGDYLVLVGMHVTTKEIPNWLWATFWWHDRPDRGPFASQRPSTVRGEWRNYLMNIAYDMNEPRESDGTPRIAFNPYLETLQEGGTTSNCMSCHILATSPKQNQATIRGVVSVGDPKLFRNRIRLDFLWSLTDDNDATTCSGH